MRCLNHLCSMSKLPDSLMKLMDSVHIKNLQPAIWNVLWSYSCKSNWLHSSAFYTEALGTQAIHMCSLKDIHQL